MATRHKVSGGLKMRGRVTLTFTDVATGKSRRIVDDNITPDSFLALVAENIGSGAPSASPLITHVALGDGDDDAAADDTELGNETERKSVASVDAAGAVVYATGYFSASEAVGTFAEVGFFADGDDTNVLASRVLIPFTKTGSETMTIDLELTLSRA